jgi:hypothetical protein
MKSLFVLSEKRVNEHAGEEYDSIMEVVDDITTENIPFYANKIMAEIRALWENEIGDPSLTVENPKVMVYLDAAPAFAAMLVNLKIIMFAQEKIIIDLPWDTPVDATQLDAESQAVLKKLEEKKNTK